MCKEKQRANINWMYIDKKGKVIEVTKISASSKEGLLPFSDNARWGYQDISGKTVIKPQFGIAGPFIDGIACVEIVEIWEPAKGFPQENPSKSHYSYITKKGTSAFKGIYTNAKDFSEGLAAVQTSDNLWGYINKKGEYVIKPKFHEAECFKNDFAPVTLDGNKWFYINKNGKRAFEGDFKWALGFSEELAAIAVEKNGLVKWGFLNTEGKIVIEAKYFNIRNFSEGLAAVCIKSKLIKENDISYDEETWGFIDKKGITVIPPSFYDALDFSNGLAAVATKDTKWGYIDNKGRIIIKLIYDRISPFTKDGYAQVGFITPQ